MSLIRLEPSFFSSFRKKVQEPSFWIKTQVNQTFFSLSLIIWGIKIDPTAMNFCLYQDSLVFILLPQSFSWYLNWIGFCVGLVSRSLEIFNFAWIYFRGLRYIIWRFSLWFSKGFPYKLLMSLTFAWV